MSLCCLKHWFPSFISTKQGSAGWLRTVRPVPGEEDVGVLMENLHKRNLRKQAQQLQRRASWVLETAVVRRASIPTRIRNNRLLPAIFTELGSFLVRRDGWAEAMARIAASLSRPTSSVSKMLSARPRAAAGAGDVHVMLEAVSFGVVEATAPVTTATAGKESRLSVGAVVDGQWKSPADGAPVSFFWHGKVQSPKEVWKKGQHLPQGIPALGAASLTADSIAVHWHLSPKLGPSAFMRRNDTGTIRAAAVTFLLSCVREKRERDSERHRHRHASDAASTERERDRER